MLRGPQGKWVSDVSAHGPKLSFSQPVNCVVFSLAWAVMSSDLNLRHT